MGSQTDQAISSIRARTCIFRVHSLGCKMGAIKIGSGQISDLAVSEGQRKQESH
jgi:hypothetical protein